MINTYQIELENFTGPLDLLLFFIRRDELDIMDIPISHITDEYLEFVEAAKFLNVAVAGEFIAMAALLMRIKAKFLLPKPVSEEEGEPEDPRTELIQRLLEYKRFKEAARGLAERADEQSRKFPRAVTFNLENSVPDAAYYLGDASIFHLVTTFKNLLSNIPVVNRYDITKEQVSVQKQVGYILGCFVDQSQRLFSEIVKPTASRSEIITTFIALLELVRDGKVIVMQKDVFEELVLQRIEA
ncbi:MAG: segregation/condensation protein A [Candidatus Marinimicrobia bacterium]|jgi:segregation and condensation protein A|nr:chromosome segregation protein ScpA [Candidatus Neomarinimicrobiota bacterium]MDP6397013.1 segregation/condensation protein A [Candidatus Neomarinimicrobiota bacterium]MDP6569060.1 segregation/condensation protein A [Candidatus Neomarinimicrobiota bacterium]MDP7026439.1 segregation/condensation protein A [Candidatus Neomarinimicrobiota bacterium]MDP7558613.1 segregation/condensation protein A [Candidatus Neomarinimicrobiota bacterium]|tara:strand:+ start:1409 stop:2134 length:726 start_codon:yes stop_codon:yes gene_type:complete